MKGGLSKRRRLTSLALLAVGYPIASWATPRLKATWRDSDPQPFVLFEVGTAVVTAGLIVRDKKLPALMNGATGLVVGVAWLSRRRRHH